MPKERHLRYLMYILKPIVRDLRHPYSVKSGGQMPKVQVPESAVLGDEPPSPTIDRRTHPQENDRESGGSTTEAARKETRMTLREVAEQAGFAEGFVSQQRGVHTGRVRTLQKLAAVSGLIIGDLFEESVTDSPAVNRFVFTNGLLFGVASRKSRLTLMFFDHLEVFPGVLEPYGSTGVEPCSHGDSEELPLVIDGEVESRAGAQMFHLSALDSLAYASSHAYRDAETAGSTPRVLWAMVPPNY